MDFFNRFEGSFAAALFFSDLVFFFKHMSNSAEFY